MDWPTSLHVAATLCARLLHRILQRAVTRQNRLEEVRFGNLLGLDWSGTLVHDGWSVYDRFTQAAHQPAMPGAFAAAVRAAAGNCRAGRALAARGAGLIDRAYALRRAWRGHRLSGDALADCGLGLACKLIN